MRVAGRDLGTDFEELIRSRHSVRAFRSRPVEPEKLRAVLEAADAAPSAGNLQAYRIVCVTAPDARSALADAALGQEFVSQAPVILVFLADPRRSWDRYGRRGSDLYSLQDATIACAYAQLQAHELGLGSTWVGAFDDTAVTRVVGNMGELRPIALLPLGYPAETPGPTPRRGLRELLSHEHV